MTSERLYTVTQLAEHMSMNPATIRRWLRDGTLRGIRLNGDSAGWRIRQRDLDAFLESRLTEEPGGQGAPPSAAGTPEASGAEDR